MAIDLTQLITNLQADVNAADSDTSTKDILALLHRGSKITTFHKWYDSVGVLPIDPAYGGYMAFTKSDNTMRVFNDSDLRWAELDSALTLSPSTPAQQGSNYGYTSAGRYLPGSTDYNIIDKFSFTSDGNATDVGDLLEYRFQQAGQSSSTHGYTSGGASPTIRNTISKHSFPSDGNATDVGDLTQARSAGAGTYSSTHGYTHGGQNPAPVGRNEIDKFSFSVDGNATDVGDLTESMSNTSGSSSTTHGYRAGGGLPMVDTIDKYSFAVDGNATDVGDMQHGPPHTHRQASGNQSSTHGYTSSGMFGSGSSSPAGVYKTWIGSFPFASDTNGSKVGDLITERRLTGGTSSTVSGYTAGGQTTPGAGSKNEIEKWPFASDGTATDVGDLTQARYGCAGTQY